MWFLCTFLKLLYLEVNHLQNQTIPISLLPKVEISLKVKRLLKTDRKAMHFVQKGWLKIDFEDLITYECKQRY